MNHLHIDLATLRELEDTAGADFVKELAEAFFEEAPGMLGEMREAYAAGAAARFRRAAHSLKTNANTFGATRLAEQAKLLELGGLPGDAGGLDTLDAIYASSAVALRAALHD
jgi:HPt (histidine-containing phosphotransfer) domain-containing protein